MSRLNEQDAAAFGAADNGSDTNYRSRMVHVRNS